MAKDTEKLIRQLSLISYLMAERRPVTALEIRRDVEGYSGMNEDAFARRFYADRAELSDLGIQLTIDKPIDGVAEQENYSLRPENFHLPAIAFTDQELASLQTALSLLDGEFAYAEPLRLALQQITWGRPSPLRAPEQSSVALGITGSAGGHELTARLAKIETAIFRNKTILFEYYTMERDELGGRRVDPYHLIFQGGQFYVLGYSHERKAIRVFRLSRIRGKVSYATKAEHDFRRPADFDPRAYANRADWQLGDEAGTAEILISERIAWQIERHFGRFGEIRAPDGGNAADADDGERLFLTPYSSARGIISWLLGLGGHARLLGPGELADELQRRLEMVGERLAVEELCERLQLTPEELREDVNVLNVVNFGGGSYVLYAELNEEAGEIEVDPEPYSDNFDRPARLLPVEAKALVAAIDLLGEHIPAGSLTSAREKIVAALGEDPMEQGLQVARAGGDDSEVARLVSGAIVKHRMIELEYYKENEDELSLRKVEPYALTNGREGWYVASFDPERDGMRHFRLDRVKRATVAQETFRPRPEVDPAAEVDGWLRTGEVEASRSARVWVSPERARWAREARRVVEERPGGAVVVELSFAGVEWLVREILREAGDAAVLEPEDAREAVRDAVARLREAQAAPAGV